MTVQIARRMFTVDDYYRMAEAGILHEDDRVELIRGEIVEMPPIGAGHASVVRRLQHLLQRKLLEGAATLSVQNPVRLDQSSEPEPDIALLRWRDDYYGDRHPVPEDVLLLIEVADSSVEYDRETKLVLYAQAGISEYWIVDIRSDSVEVYKELDEAGYQSKRIAGRDETLVPANLSHLSITVADILG
jgi:Uma2 family endonuclease